MANVTNRLENVSNVPLDLVQKTAASQVYFHLIKVCGSLTSGDRKIPAPNQGCKCDDGWAGLNCNVCTKDEVCNPLVEAGVNGTCYTGPVVVKRHFKSCTASVPLLEEMFPEKQPAITFGCNIHKQNNNTCSFQCTI